LRSCACVRDIERRCQLLRLYHVVADEWVSTEHSWNDTDCGKRNYFDKILSIWRFFHHKCHINWPGIETVPTLYSGS